MLLHRGSIYGKLKTERGKRKTENGKRKTENGKWRTENGKQYSCPSSKRDEH